MSIEDIALNVRAFRKKRKLTLGEMAARTGVTKGCLSQIENRQALPSVSLLYRLAEGLGITPSELLQCKVPDPVHVFTLAGQGAPQAHAHAHPMEAWFELARDKRLKLMNPLMLEIPAQTALRREVTRMDQFIYGIEGRVHVTLNHEEFMLTPGDSIYFNGHVAHEVANRAELMAKVLVIHATQATAQSAV
jgi:transcriptional regulator with XRE-family HTH domain